MNIIRLFLTCIILSAVFVLLVLVAPLHAQTSAPAGAPAAVQPVSPQAQTADQSANLLPSSYPHHYLEQHIQLTEDNKNFYASRQELGCSFDGGATDNTVTTSVKFIVDQAVLTAYLNSLKLRVASDAVPAHPVLVKPFEHETALTSDNVVRPAVIIPAEPSTELLVPDSAAAITSAFQQNPIVESIPLVIKTGVLPATAPSLVGIDSRIAHFVTHFDTGEVGRTQTVRLAIELIDGKALEPKEIFSINQTVGERTVARGFGIGKVFINGTMENQVGGGMCQVATTLFNAALLANLNIVERHQHVRTVPYVPAGGDATVYFGEKDFQFQNNTDAPIYIYYKTYGRFAVCDLYGKGDPNTTVRVVTSPTRLGPRYYKGVIQRFVTVDGKTTSNFTA